VVFCQTVNLLTQHLNKFEFEDLEHKKSEKAFCVFAGIASKPPKVSSSVGTIKLVVLD
jgi:hypothetical protein